jgi:hypothetical protein
MAPSPDHLDEGKRVGEEVVARIKVALAAWSELDVSGLSEHFSEHVVFGSPSTEWVGDRGWTEGKDDVLRRFARERSNFTELELVKIMVENGRATVLLRDGLRLMTCLVELDADGRFSRLVSFFVAPPGDIIARPDCPGRDEIA